MKCGTDFIHSHFAANICARKHVMDRYQKIAQGVPTPVGRASAVTYLNRTLPPLWATDYPPTGGELTTITLGGKMGREGAVSTLFDVPHKGSETDGRVVAVWGVSQAVPSNTCDAARRAGLLRNEWSTLYPGRDRGHFFAHTMGGGLDINLFPQLTPVNRWGEWRRMESYAAENPGTFCFMRPFYADRSWTPSKVEYGIYKMPPNNAFRFWGNIFLN